MVNGIAPSESSSSVSDRRLRCLLGVLAALWAIFVVYASCLPMRYHPLSFAETWETFLRIPWLQLDLGRRADWVANGLILVPLGFLVAGSLHYGRSSMTLKQASLMAFALLHGLFVCAIEFIQAWFPPRVLSLNDMLAGYLGGLVGMLLWHWIGNRVVQTGLEFARASRGFTRIFIVAQCCVFGMVFFNAMPLDIMLTPTEWGKKVSAGRLVWMPFSDWGSVGQAAKSILLSLWAFPLGVVFGMRYPARNAVVRVAAWCGAIELASLPIFHRQTSTTDIVITMAIGLAGIRLHQPALRCLQRVDRPRLWLSAAAAWSVVVIAGFTARFTRVVTGEELTDRLWSMLAVPFARAQRSSEIGAAENFLLKLSTFALLGFLLIGWHNRATRTVNKKTLPPWRITVVVLWISAVAITVELAQAALFPLVPDVTDLILYGTGAAIGVLTFWLLVPEDSPNRP